MWAGRAAAAQCAGTGPGRPATGCWGYAETRRLVYLPTYRWVLEHPAAELVAELRRISAVRDVVLLDHTTNSDVADLGTPLSHAAALVRSFLTGDWPAESPSDGGSAA